jgi:hypothetical protein
MFFFFIVDETFVVTEKTDVVTPPYIRRLTEHVFERLTAFTTATERTTELSIERSIERLEMTADTAISRLSLAASQLELERQGRSSLGKRSSSGVSSASPSTLVDQRPAAGVQKKWRSASSNGIARPLIRTRSSCKPTGS